MSESKQKSEDSLDEGLDDKSAVTPETNEFIVLSKCIIDFSRKLVDLRDINFPFEQIYGHDVDDETMKTIMDTHTEKIHHTVLDTLAMLQVFIDSSDMEYDEETFRKRVDEVKNSIDFDLAKGILTSMVT